MKTRLQAYLCQSVNSLIKKGILNFETNTPVSVSRNEILTQGDFSTNIALVLAKKAGISPRELASKILEELYEFKQIYDHQSNLKIEVAGPGFINFYIQHGISKFQPYDYSNDGRYYDGQYNVKPTDKYFLIKSTSPTVNFQIQWDDIEDFGTSSKKELIGFFDSIKDASNSIDDLLNNISYYLVKGAFVIEDNGIPNNLHLIANKDFVHYLNDEGDNWTRYHGDMKFTYPTT